MYRTTFFANEYQSPQTHGNFTSQFIFQECVYDCCNSEMSETELPRCGELCGKFLLSFSPPSLIFNATRLLLIFGAFFKCLAKIKRQDENTERVNSKNDLVRSASWPDTPFLYNLKKERKKTLYSL